MNALGKPTFDLAEAIPRIGARVRSAGAVSYAQYPDSRGMIELRQRIASRENEKYGLRLSADNIVVTNGATEAIALLVHAFTDTDDQVVVQSPAIFLYRDIIENHGAQAVPLGESADKPKLRILHNPSNPEGRLLDAGELRTQSEQARLSGALLVIDQVYDELLYGVSRPAEDQDAIDAGHLVKVNSVSKGLGAPGLRIGWIACRSDIAAMLSGLGERLRLAVSILTQVEALALLESPIDELAPSLSRRLHLVTTWLQSTPLFEAIEPQGGVFCWLRLRHPFMSASDLCRRALEEEGVWLLPGQMFWGGADHHLRLSFGVEQETLAEGLRRLTRVCRRLF